MPKPLFRRTELQAQRLAEISEAMLRERQLVWLPWLLARDKRIAAARQEMGLEPSRFRRRLRRPAPTASR